MAEKTCSECQLWHRTETPRLPGGAVDLDAPATGECRLAPHALPVPMLDGTLAARILYLPTPATFAACGSFRARALDARAAADPLIAMTPVS